MQVRLLPRTPKGAKFNKSEFSERGQRPPPTSEANGKTMNVTKEELEKATASMTDEEVKTAYFAFKRVWERRSQK